MSGNRCMYNGCESTPRKRPDLRFHRFPKGNKEIQEQWIKNTGNPLLLNAPLDSKQKRVLCGIHFAKNATFPSGRLMAGSLPFAYGDSQDSSSKDSPSPKPSADEFESGHDALWRNSDPKYVYTARRARISSSDGSRTVPEGGEECVALDSDSHLDTSMTTVKQEEYGTTNQGDYNSFTSFGDLTTEQIKVEPNDADEVTISLNEDYGSDSDSLTSSDGLAKEWIRVEPGIDETVNWPQYKDYPVELIQARERDRLMELAERQEYNCNNRKPKEKYCHQEKPVKSTPPDTTNDEPAMEQDCKVFMEGVIAASSCPDDGESEATPPPQFEVFIKKETDEVEASIFSNANEDKSDTNLNTKVKIETESLDEFSAENCRPTVGKKENYCDYENSRDWDFNVTSSAVPHVRTEMMMDNHDDQIDIDEDLFTAVTSPKAEPDSSEEVLTSKIMLKTEHNLASSFKSSFISENNMVTDQINPEIIVKLEVDESSNSISGLNSNERILSDQINPKIIEKSEVDEAINSMSGLNSDERIINDQLNPEIVVKSEFQEKMEFIEVNPEIVVKSEIDESSTCMSGLISDEKAVTSELNLEIIVKSYEASNQISDERMLPAEPKRIYSNPKGSVENGKNMMEPVKQSDQNAAGKPNLPESLTQKLIGTKTVKCNACHTHFNLKNYSVKHLRIQEMGKLSERMQQNKMQTDMTNELKSRMTFETLTLRCKVCEKVFRDNFNQSEGTVSRSVRDPSCCLSCLPKPMDSSSPDAQREELRPENAHFLCLSCVRNLRTNHSSQTSVSKHAGFKQIPRAEKHSPTTKGGKFKCKYCGKIMLTLRGLIMHARIHNRPLVCEICGLKFVSTDALDSHRHIHTMKKPYLCHFCGVLFRESSIYEMHMEKVHEMENKSSPTDSRLIRTYVRRSYQLHMTRPAVKKPYFCYFCGLKFRELFIYHVHLKKAHKEENE